MASNYGAWQGLYDVSKNALLTGMKVRDFQQNQQQLEMQERNRQELLRQAQEKMGMDKQFHQDTLGIQREQLDLAKQAKAMQEQTVALAKKEFYTKNPEQVPWDYDKFAGIYSELAQSGKKPENLVFMNKYLKDLAQNPEAKSGHVAQAIRQNWNEWSAETNEGLFKKVASLSNKMSEMSPNDPEYKKAQNEVNSLLEQMKKVKDVKADDIVGSLFPEIVVKEQAAQKKMTMDELKIYIATHPGAENSLTPGVRTMLGLDKTPGTTAHGVHPVTSPDGKTRQDMQYNPRTERYDIPVGDPYPVSSQVINVNTQSKLDEGFKTWTEEAKGQAFMFNAITGEPPVSTRGMASNDRSAYAKAFTQWQVDKGLTPQVLALMRTDYKAGDMTFKNMAKQEGPMSAFVGNINKQIEKVKQLYDNNDRIGLRLIDKPIRDLKVLAKGSGDEAVKASYLLEISNEIGKLSSGASASVQQLSDSAKEDWKKVHDPNLSFKEIMKVVNATRDQANMRLQSWREAKQEVRQTMMGIGGETPTVQTPNPVVPSIELPNGYKKGW